MPATIFPTTLTPEQSARLQKLQDTLKNAHGYGKDRKDCTLEYFALRAQYPTFGAPAGAAKSMIPWDEAEERRRFNDGRHWNTFTSQCPGNRGFIGEVQSLIMCLRVLAEVMEENQSALGETFLVGWALHNIPSPMSDFLKMSLHAEEFSEDQCGWTIRAFEDHLLTWNCVFKSPAVTTYVKEEALKETRRLFVPNFFDTTQRPIAGGWVAQFMFSRMEHRRWALQMFKLIWMRIWINTAVSKGDLLLLDYENDTNMSGMGMY